MDTNPLDKPVQFLKGVGPARARLFSRIGIETVGGLLSYFPREYNDRRVPVKIASLIHGQRATVMGKVEAVEALTLSKNLTAFKAAIHDGTGIVTAVFFRKSNPYHKHDIFGALRKVFMPKTTVFVNGAVEVNFGRKEIRVEEYEVFAGPDGKKNDLVHFSKIVPVYPLTEGLNQKWLRGLVWESLKSGAEFWPELVLQEYSLSDISAVEAVRSIHFPQEMEDSEKARRYFAFNEFLVLETALELARNKIARLIKPQSYEIKKTILTPFRNKLGFDFTQSQKKVINEIFSDMQSAHPMNRLLMGDVGSGKTVAALSAMLLAVENGSQTVFLAPTEILAGQHYSTIKRFLDGLGVETALVTGELSKNKKKKEETLKRISSGEINIVVGTHAVLEGGVKFKNFSLAVIDEQHRFGVIQRAQLQSKGRLCDVLLLTATPIPRTLALAYYGDMNISVLRGMPPGRIPVKTFFSSAEQAYASVKEELKKGRQAYIVYPLVEESDKSELKAAVKEAETLSQTVFKEHKVGIMHGQMKSVEKERSMDMFKNRELDILIATTVIEVGIDVPNASVMVIEHADRFGLATLHQLRGRVGRSNFQSYCFLLGEARSEDARKRIEIMVENTDGFKIAEEDLILRGPGEFFGVSQHGSVILKAGNIVTDGDLIDKARSSAQKIVEGDILLSVFPRLKEEVIRSYGKGFNLFSVG